MSTADPVFTTDAAAVLAAPIGQSVRLHTRVDGCDQLFTELADVVSVDGDVVELRSEWRWRVLLNPATLAMRTAPLSEGLDGCVEPEYTTLVAVEVLDRCHRSEARKAEDWRASRAAAYAFCQPLGRQLFGWRC